MPGDVYLHDGEAELPALPDAAQSRLRFSFTELRAQLEARQDVWPAEQTEAGGAVDSWGIYRYLLIVVGRRMKKSVNLVDFVIFCLRSDHDSLVFTADFGYFQQRNSDNQ